MNCMAKSGTFLLCRWKPNTVTKFPALEAKEVMFLSEKNTPKEEKKAI